GLVVHVHVNRRIRARAQRVHLDSLAVCDGGFDVRVAAALEVRPQNHETSVSLRRQHDISFRRFLRIPRRCDEELAALALETPAGPTSSSAFCQASSTLPTITASPSAGGISITTGPPVVS